ncbi:hypothetical protein HEK616_53450 [Streptomyces nigrescens]|uniref:PPE family domain-containing protein n=1 Tax=Streptomyces nigrescens TaxID=1920 RepID=A0ABN6R5L7_STRNI|nr:hypothetical protein [Streptomyces nigrescens]BDM71858.1 hypothetical protein HEK616_53450 [Streptomyces nigrescens]
MGGDAGGAPTGGNTWETFTTKFNLNDLDGLKGMLDGANVQQVRDVAQNWQDLHDQLVGSGEGGGGIQKRFEDAVKKVLESWHGDTAEKFAKQAQKISNNFRTGAPYATHAAQVMGQTASDLQKAIDKVRPVDDGWNWSDDVWGEMPWSDQIDDDDLNDALKTGVSTQGILDANKDNLSGHQKKRLEAAVAMENLGTAYVTRASSLKTPTPPIDDKIPEHDPSGGAGGGVGAIAMPMPGGGGIGGGGGGGGVKIPTRGMKGGSAPKMPTSPSINTPNTPKTPGISGGLGSMKPHTPNVNTGLDGLGGGGGGTGVKIPGGGGAGGLNGGAGGGVHMPGGGGGGAGVNIPGGGGLGMAGGTGGMTGRGAGGVKGGAGGLKGGTAGAGGAAGARTGRAGMPGMGGAHGGAAGKGMGGKPGVSTGGAMARQKGGIVGGAAGGKSSTGGQGGSGLHRSRGGTAAGTNSGSGRRPAGMMGGAHGAHGGKGEGKGNDSSRPDYLVEDEETWTTERNVAPRVIE